MSKTDQYVNNIATQNILLSAKLFVLSILASFAKPLRILHLRIKPIVLNAAPLCSLYKPGQRRVNTERRFFLFPCYSPFAQREPFLYLEETSSHLKLQYSEFFYEIVSTSLIVFQFIGKL